MSTRASSFLRAFAVACLIAAVPVAIVATQAPPDLTVHEWGTFTTIAAQDGTPMQWLPLGGPTDLPCFVETFSNREFKVTLYNPNAGKLLDYQQARAGLKGTVRMETPVLYFYADRPLSASVTVGFPQGLFTEFYPKADVVQSPTYANVLATPPGFPSRIIWKNVSVQPGAAPKLPTDSGSSHYYAARATDAAPVRVGGQDEKFLFYRGVAGFPVPIKTALRDDGRIEVTNRSEHAMPGVILMTKQGGKFGYRIHGELAPGASVVLDRPLVGGMLNGLRQELVRTLVTQGLYEAEAKAMVETWRDDWFNDGTRVLYFVPTADIDRILPLTISPAPVSTVRAFVGRMEVITPESEADVLRALLTNDKPLIEAYGRWLGPIGDRLVFKATSAETKAQLLERMDQIFKAYLTRVTACQ
jgi:hypothetical protein